MGANSENPPQPRWPASEDEQKAADQGAHERVWSEPIGTGEPVEFDPEKFESPMSDEEIDKLLAENKKK